MRSLLLASAFALGNAQQILIKAEQQNVVAYANDLQLKTSLGGPVIGSISSLTSAMSAMTGTISTVSSVASEAQTDSNANGIAAGQLATQLTSLSNQAASQSTIASNQVASLVAQVSSITAALGRLANHDATVCANLCTPNGGTCSQPDISTGVISCTCTGGRSGPYCDITPSPTAVPTRIPTMPPTYQRVTSCAGATSSGTYSTPNGYDIYCLVQGNDKWTKIVYWPGNTYAQNVNDVNPTQCAVASPSGMCKLSDTKINNLVGGSSQRIYWLQPMRSDMNSNSFYLRTSQAFADTSPSWGITPQQSNGTVAQSFPGDSFTGTTFRNGWVDFLYVSTQTENQRETCQRYFIGHGANDCWSGPANERCIRGGSECNLGGQQLTRYSYVNGWTMWAKAV